MITFPNAKINLGLNIVEKRSDGYHNIETLFYPIEICDALEFVPSTKETTFTTTGLPIEGNSTDNLVLKAYHLLSREYNLPAIDIHLHKKIPMGAGLGGGSSDAAFMLKLLNDYFKLNISNEKLADFASLLGADCAFFIYNKPMFGCGKGNILSEIPIDLSNHYIVTVSSNVHVSTAEAYSQCMPRKWDIPLKEIISLPIHQWRNLLYNDFEKSVFPKHPELQQIKDTLYNYGAEYAAMSGSGSTIYGIFTQKQDKDYIQNQLEKNFSNINIKVSQTTL